MTEPNTDTAELRRMGLYGIDSDGIFRWKRRLPDILTAVAGELDALRALLREAREFTCHIDCEAGPSQGCTCGYAQWLADTDRVAAALSATPAEDGETGEALDCDGSERCDAALHVHGCYSDEGTCERPDEHRPVPAAAPAEGPGEAEVEGAAKTLFAGQLRARGVGYSPLKWDRLSDEAKERLRESAAASLVVLAAAAPAVPGDEDERVRATERIDAAEAVQQGRQILTDYGAVLDGADCVFLASSPTSPFGTGEIVPRGGVFPDQHGQVVVLAAARPVPAVPQENK